MKRTKIQMLAILAMLVAVHVVLSRFASINAWNIKIGLAFIPVFVAAWLYGPLAAALVGGVGDFLGAILFPIGPYFPGFTLSCALTGIVMGLLLHKRQSLRRIVTAAVINQMGIGLFLTTLWISILYGSPYHLLLGTRIFQAVVMLAVEIAVVTAMSKTPLHRLTGNI